MRETRYFIRINKISGTVINHYMNFIEPIEIYGTEVLEVTAETYFEKFYTCSWE